MATENRTKLSPQFNIYVALPIIIAALGVMWWLYTVLQWLQKTLPSFWAHNWIPIVVVGSILLLGGTSHKWVPKLWGAHRALDLHKQEKLDREAQRQLLQAATAKLSEGYNTKYANTKTGDLLEVMNPYVIAGASRRPQAMLTEEQEPAMMLDAPQTVKAENLRIPTFTESMQSGLIGPGQNEMLICFELERDEETGDLTGEMRPYQDKLENNCTMFLGGASKSGKSTLMAHLAGQSAMMNALFYVIDPHLSHPERSITAKIQSLSHAFILPPASSDADVHRVLTHASAEAEARVQGRETPYSGRPIVFIVDEVLNLFGRAQRKPDDKNLQKLYIDLSLFLRDLGTQFNKYGMNGIIASQYVTKDAFKLPGGNVDFRDGCQNQTLLRLPANQAQAMRLLQRDELRGVRRLPPGHGYMGFSTGEVIRMAAGNVTVRDIEMAGQIVAAVPNAKQYSFGAVPVPTGTRINSGVPRIVDTDPATYVSERRHERSTGELKSGVATLENRAEQGTTRRMKEFTSEQELEFVQKFEQYRSIKRTLGEMGVSYGDYQACASRLVARKQLRGE